MLRKVSDFLAFWSSRMLRASVFIMYLQGRDRGRCRQAWSGWAKARTNLNIFAALAALFCGAQLLKQRLPGDVSVCVCCRTTFARLSTPRLLVSLGNRTAAVDGDVEATLLRDSCRVDRRLCIGIGGIKCFPILHILPPIKTTHEMGT